MQVTLAADYVPHAKQLQFHESTARFKVACAGNRGGKTVAGAVEFLRNIYRDVAAGRGKKPVNSGGIFVPRLRYWVVTPTHDMGRYSFDEILRYCPRELIVGNPNKTTLETRLIGDVLIEFRSTERPERLIAASLNGIWMDEASKCKTEAWRGGLRARIGDQRGFALFTTTPYGGQNNWVYKDLVVKADSDPLLESFSWTTADNDYFPRDEFEHAKATQPEAWFRRDWLADWQSFGGAIFDEFKTEAHVISEASFRLRYGLGNQPFTAELCKRIFRRVVVGVDWGFTSPGAMVVIGHFGDARAVVLEESYAPMRPILGSAKTTWLSEAQRLRTKYGATLFVCDHQPNAINDLATNGIPCIPAFKDVHMGIRRVSEFLHPNANDPGMQILDSCTHLVAEMRSYQWKSTRDQSGFAEVPAEGQSDHAVDALRYGCVELRPFAKQNGIAPPVVSGRGAVY